MTETAICSRRELIYLNSSLRLLHEDTSYNPRPVYGANLKLSKDERFAYYVGRSESLVSLFTVALGYCLNRWALSESRLLHSLPLRPQKEESHSERSEESNEILN